MQIHFECMRNEGYIVNRGTKMRASKLSLLKYCSASDTKDIDR